MAKRKVKTSRGAFIDLAKQRFQQGVEADTNQRTRELEDLKFYAGDQWPEDIKALRKGQTLNQNQPPVPARPMITINLTREPVRQILNQERQSDMGIELVPADDFGGLTEPIDHTEIELREGIIRRIQRDSEAADARTWAFSRGAIAGRGFYGVMTRYAPGKTFDQEVFIQRFYNQAAVTLDPAHEQPDGSDAEWAFVGKDYSFEEYKAEFGRLPGNKKNSLTELTDQEWRNLGDEEPGWFTSENEIRGVRVVDYYYTVHESRDLAALSDGTLAWADELPEGVTPIETRRVATKKIKWAKLDGCQVLDETDWPGHYIPIIKVVGEELQPFDKERRSEGMVRPAMDACRSSNYMISKWVEVVGLAPIPQWLMAAGQDEGFEGEWDGANTRTFGRLHYNQKDINGQDAPMPGRISAQVDVNGIAQAVSLFGELTNKVMATPETSLGQVDPSIKSGKLAALIMERGQQGTSNFLDNLVRSMRHEARIVNDLLYPIYGARQGRLARLMNPEGEHESVLIGQPFVMNGEGPQAKPQPAEAGQEGAKTYKLTEGAEWNVAIKISKNFETRRQQEAHTLGEIIAADPNQMAVIGDLFFKYQDGPGHEEMADRYKLMLAPPIQQKLSGEQQIPPEVQAQMAQMQQAMQELQELADKNKTDLQKTQMQQQSETERAALESASKERLEMRKLEVQLEIEMAKLGSAQSMARAELEQQELHQHNEQSLQREQMQATQAEAAIDRQAERDASSQEHQQTLQQGEQAHGQALESGAQQAQAASALSAQNAAQQPPPESGE